MKTFRDQRFSAEKIADEILKEKILRGLELLKKEYGEDWVEKIDPDRLDMSSCTYCVLGQLEGNYEVARDRLKITGSVYGFDSGGSSGYRDLTEAWRLVIRE